MTQSGELTLALRSADFTTAARIATAINEDLEVEVASPMNPGTVQLTIPDDWSERAVQLLSRVEQIDVIPASQATVVINERTGTVVVGQNVTLSSCALAHGGLTIQVEEGFSVSQPGAFAGSGTTATVPESRVAVSEGAGELHLVPDTSTVGDLVTALNALGVSPRDLVSIFQALHAAGALRARLEVH